MFLDMLADCISKLTVTSVGVLRNKENSWKNNLSSLSNV